MPRKRVVAKREIISDPKYKSVLVAKFVNNLTLKTAKRGLNQKSGNGFAVFYA